MVSRRRRGCARSPGSTSTPAIDISIRSDRTGLFRSGRPSNEERAKTSPRQGLHLAHSPDFHHFDGGSRNLQMRMRLEHFRGGFMRSASTKE